MKRHAQMVFNIPGANHGKPLPLRRKPSLLSESEKAAMLARQHTGFVELADRTMQHITLDILVHSVPY